MKSYYEGCHIVIIVLDNCRIAAALANGAISKPFDAPLKPQLYVQQAK